MGGCEIGDMAPASVMAPPGGEFMGGCEMGDMAPASVMAPPARANRAAVSRQECGTSWHMACQAASACAIVPVFSPRLPDLGDEQVSNVT